MTTTSASPASNARTSDRTARRRKAWLGAAAALLALWTATAAPATDMGRRAGERDHEYAHRLREEGAIVSLESVVERAQSMRPGKLLEVEFDTKRSVPRYEVELLDENGEVWELKFDARDGRFLEEELEDD